MATTTTANGVAGDQGASGLRCGRQTGGCGWSADPGPAAADRRQDRADQQLQLPAAEPDDRLRHCRARPQPADRLQRADLAGPWRLLRGRRLCGRHPDRSWRLALLGDAAGCRHRLLHRRLSVRSAGAAARGALSGARHVRARDRRAADPQVPAPRGLHARRAGHQPHQAGRRRSDCRSAATSGCIWWCWPSRVVMFWIARNLLDSRTGPRADRDPRPFDGREHHGRQRLALQGGDVRHQRALHGRRRRAARHHLRVRVAGQLPLRAVDRHPGRRRRRRHRLAAGRRDRRRVRAGDREVRRRPHQEDHRWPCICRSSSSRGPSTASR